MNKKSVIVSALFLTTAIGSTGCSQQEVKQEQDQGTAVPVVTTPPVVDNTIQAVEQNQAVVNVKPPQPPVIKKENVNNTVVATKRVPKRPVVVPKRPQYQKNIVPRTRKVPWVSRQPYRLAGDFANNSAAQRFIRSMSRSYGMDSNYLNRLFSQARDLQKQYKPPKVRKRYNKVGRWTRYRNVFMTPRHINGGVNFWRQHEATLNRAYQQYGVPPEYIVGILGVETIYGGNIGKARVIDSLSTKAFRSGRRQSFFRDELRKFLLMARSEGLNPIGIVGSPAGAVGLCQFMPSNFKPFGVDYNRNGTCNLWTPEDAIGSVANYLKKHNWRRGGPVVVRASTTGNGYKSMKTSYKKKYSLSRLARKGIRPQGRMDSTVRFLRMSTYAGDEVWLGGHNFYVITRYNHDSRYALVVHQLGQEVKRRYLRSRGRVATR